MPRPSSNDPTLVEAPHLALLMNEIARRKSWERDTPLIVSRELYDAALDEHVEIQVRRGFPVATDYNLKRPNFMLHGTVICHG